MSSTRSCPSPFPLALPGSPGRACGPVPRPGNGGADAGTDAGADALGVPPPAALAAGVPLTRKNPTATPAIAATTATTTAAGTGNPETPP
ncbi:MAG: hypothetical protein ABSB59_02205 [Streptosporangiaceae bacterium]